MKVEKELRDLLGLNAQIFRIDIDSKPVQATLSDGLTLKAQPCYPQVPVQMKLLLSK